MDAAGGADRMGYEEWNEAYAHPLSELPWELGKPRPQLVKLIESERIKPGKALDICCGAGTNTVYLASKGFTVSGIDISSRAISIAKQKARAAGVKIRFRVGNSVRLPYNDGEFDFVFDMGCFHHIRPEDRESYVEGVRRVLKEGGRYFMVCFSWRNGPAWNHFSEEQLMDVFSPSFDILEVEHFASVEGDGITRYFYSILMEK